MSLAASAPEGTARKPSRPRMPLAVKFVAALAGLVVLVLLVNSAVSPLFSYAIGLLLAAILGIWLAHRIAAPLGRLQEGVDQLANGDLSQRIAIRTGDEIAALADGVNTMAGRIQESQVALKAKAEEHTHDLDEALQQQTATSEILRAISSSRTDAQPVFDTIAQSAAKLCGAEFCFVDRFDGTLLHFMAHYGLPPEAIETINRTFPTPPGRGSAAARAVSSRAVAQIPDMQADPDYEMGALAELLRSRSGVAVPMLKDGVPIGVIAVDRLEAGDFPDRQIELLKTFADQAVIAIENVRLFDEVQARTREVTEALEQQTATGAILQVIAGSPTDIQPVLDAVAESAARLCDAYDSTIYLLRSDRLAVGAHHGPIPIDDAGLPVARDIVTGRAVLDRAPVHVHDLTIAGEEFATARTMAQRLGFRAILATPLLQEGKAIGALMIRRIEARAFSDSQIDLLKTFANQAVIAIGNVRLFEEVRARTAELSESLQQQTATADVLKVISRSAFDLGPILQTLVDSAIRLGDADMGAITLREGDVLRFTAGTGPEELLAYERTHPHPIGRGTFQGRAAVEGATIHVPDILLDPEYERREAAEIGHFRAALSVPLKRDQETIGVFGLARRIAGPFTSRQIELVQTFADQAVIAIENARLFDEVQSRTAELGEALQQQTATADVLKVISRSAFDLDTVLETLVQSAARLCDSGPGLIFRRDGEVYRFASGQTLDPEFERRERELEVRPGRGTIVGRALLEKRVVQVADVREDPEYEHQDIARAGNLRSVLAVPLLRQGEPIGAFGFSRGRVEPFTDRQVELVKTFADQAVIAIENVRLFDEVRARTTELSEALQQQTATADVLKVISASAFDLQSVLDTLVESAVRLCRADKGCLERIIDGKFEYAAIIGFPPGFREYGQAHQTEPGRGSAVGRAAEERRVIQIEDIMVDPEYTHSAVAAVGGMRTVLAVPLLREDELLGTFAMIRTEVRPFSEREIELVRTFADQAVIAIENVRLFDEVQARTADLTEALQQQTATADVLKAISRSTFDLPTVLNALVESAARLCGANYGGIFLRDGDVLRGHATISERKTDWSFDHPIAINRRWISGRVVLSGHIEHITDVEEDDEFNLQEFRAITDTRALMGVPLLREGKVEGVFFLGKPEPGSFTARQSELVQTFADQAVIAIENVRLFDEVQARTAELAAALQQQTATADVLKVISRSAFDLQTVLDTLTQSAADLGEADMAGITRPKAGSQYYYATNYNLPSDWLDYVKDRGMAPGRGSVVGRALLDRQIVHVHDVLSDPEYNFLQSTDKVWYRTVLGVPLMREGSPVGVLILARDTVRPFTEKQIDLIQTFADQAVIAIENSRLFEQVQARTEELSRSIEELKTAQGRLIQTEKLASLGQLTAGIAHEIKNPLNFVNNFSSLSSELIDELRDILEHAVLDEKTRADIEELADLLKGNLDKVAQHGKRADSIVKNMLLHSREGSGDHRFVDINAVVDESLGLAYHGARAERKDFNITLEKTLDPEAGKVDLYPQEITRVLLNLISNGFYATVKRGAEANGAYEPVLAASTKNLGDSVEIRIRDNGTGIPTEVKEKMFNPFFTTKPAGEGTGLGLSLSHDIIVKQHAGTIEVDTEPGSFTEFRIVLPRSAASLGKSGEAE